MNNKKTLLFGALAMSMGFASCVNEDYDLENLDTTIGIKVKDLTVAMKMEEVNLDKVLDLNEGETLSDTIIDPTTGKQVYAVLKDGTFDSDPITIKGFTADAPTIKAINGNISLEETNKEITKKVNDEIERIVDEEVARNKKELTAKLEKEYDDAVDTYTAELRKKGYSESTIAALVEQFKKSQLGAREDIAPTVAKQIDEKADSIKRAPETRELIKKNAWEGIDENQVFIEYDLTKLGGSTKTSFSVTSDNVDKALRSISAIQVNNAVFNLKLEIKSLEDILNMEIENVELQLPKGLGMAFNDKNASYNSKDGKLSLGTVKLTNGKYNLKGVINHIDTDLANIKLTTKNDAPGTFTFENTVGVNSGTVKVCKNSFIGTMTIFDLPNQASYTCTPTLGDIEVKAIDGSIRYDISKPNIAPVDLSNLPDILSDEKTNVVLGNPQLYLQISNPIINDNIKPELGFSLIPSRKGVKSEAKSLDGNKHIVLSKADNIFCLSPSKPGKYYYGFGKAEHLGYKSLANVLEGKGLPDQIEVDVTPEVPTTEVSDFMLNRTIEPVHGKYTFYAPLNLAKGSIVEYNDTIDGWNDDTMEDLTITKLVLNAKVMTDLPLAATLKLTPIDVNKKKLSGIDEISDVKLEAHNNDQNVQFVLTSKSGIKGLDGIILSASVVASGADEILKPTNKINIKEVKVTISGEYVSIDDDK